MSMLAEVVELVIGVDTHTDTHTAAVVVAATGALLETVTVSADPDGYQELIGLAGRHGGLRAFAVEGAGGYGAGLARHLATAGEVVVELDRPARPARRGGRRSDPLDAERAARDALARTHLAAPKTGPQRGALQALLAARRSAVEAATDAQRQLRALVITAPEPVRARFRGHRSTRAQLTVAAGLRPTTSSGDVEVVTALSVLRGLARRVRALEAEATDHEKAIRAVVAAWRPDLLELPGVGPINAAVVLTAWSHPGRCRDEAAFAMLAGAAPIPASSGRTVRYRLNRCGNRQLNRALHSIALSRQRYHQPTREYTDSRRAQGKTDREIRRCLKRYIARQLYRQLEPAGVDEP
ncbi:IS110 family transposase [Actinomycetospora cinnamomea]|uniref:Transposase n=1 Tax=Actinomycetospora cinnamomea TaxID=663609 RepID=A0A2U1E503_9PSEU|nr:IS110 family transposase [Actinomycetospora cinnamomea]PVY95034.1 transposase [Actinomycetospora cinnamomea]